jgi:phosphoesterase RecJ-like protein
MTLDKAVIQEARKRLEEANSVLIASHIGPDGDAVCSTLALGLALQDKGKTVQMVLSDGPARGFDHLAGIDQIKDKAEGEFDLVIGVDCGDKERLGASVSGQETIHINIDHHVTNTMYGEINLVDTTSVAACAVLAEHFEALGLEFTPAIVDSLLTGLLTDTLGLRTSNMTPTAMHIAGDLLERGANIQVLYEKALMKRPFAAMRHWGQGLIKLQLEDGLLWSTLTLEDRRASGYEAGDDAELINTLASTEGASITLLVIEQENKQCKVSWRSRGDYDVATLAASFGGGGHRAASGATIDGGLDDVLAKMIAASREVLEAGAGKV